MGAARWLALGACQVLVKSKLPGLGNLPQRTMAEMVTRATFKRLFRVAFKPMFRVFRQDAFRRPQRGDGMWPPLAYGIDVFGILAGIVLTIALLTVAWLILPFIVH